VGGGGCCIHYWSQILNKRIPDTRFPRCFKPVPSRVWCRNGNHSVTLCDLQYIEMTLNIYFAIPPAVTEKKIHWIGKIKINTFMVADMKGDCRYPFQTYCLIIRLERERKELAFVVFSSFAWISNRVLSEYNLQSCAASIVLSLFRNFVKRTVRFPLRMCKMRLFLL